VVVMLMGILTAMAVPQLLAGVDRSRARVAARYLAARMALARQQAVARSASVAIRFGGAATGYEMAMFVDGNGNGLRTVEILAGVDRPIEAPERIAERFPGVNFGLSPDTGISGSPIKIGTSNLFTFTPVGTASSGSIYLLGRDGTQFVVRVLGATARTRVLRYAPGRGAWLEP
jgi:type II secretory pathway pseudopilin PulG